VKNILFISILFVKSLLFSFDPCSCVYSGGLFQQDCEMKLSGFPITMQEKTNWCWAACCLSVVKWYDEDAFLNQYNIVYYATGGDGNVTNNVCSDASGKKGMYNILEHYTGLKTICKSNKLTLTETLELLESNIPIVAELDWHVVIIYGAIKERYCANFTQVDGRGCYNCSDWQYIYYVMDPLEGARMVFSNSIGDIYGEWERTLYINSTPERYTVSIYGN